MNEMFDTQLGGSSTERLRIRDEDEDSAETGTGGVIQLPLQQEEPPSIAYYKCSWCEFNHPTERTVRAHITREEDGNHKNRNGFLDDIFVQAYDDDGTLIGDMESPNANPREPVTEDHLPEGVSMDSRAGEILKVAIENPQMSEPDIADEVYGDESMSGNNSYVYRVIENHLSAASAEEDTDEPRSDQPLTASTRRGLTAEPSDEQVQKPSDEKTYDDLQPPQKVVVNEYIRNEVDNLDRPMTEIEDAAGVSTGYGSRIVDKYEHIIEQRRDAYEDGDLDLPEPDAILGDTPADEDRKGYDDLSPLQQRVIDWGVLYEIGEADITKKKLEENAGASPGYSARTFRNYDYILDRRKDAYRQGVLTEAHLNTPDKDEFTDADGNKLPDDEQPRGITVQDAQADTPAVKTTDEPETAASAAATTQTTATPETAASASDEAVADVREDMEALETSVSTRFEQITGRLKDLEETAESLTNQMEAVDEQMAVLEAAVEESADGEVSVQPERAVASDGTTSVTLDAEDWSTVIRALSNYLPEEDDDLLRDVVVQA